MTDIELRLWFDARINDLFLGMPDDITGIPTVEPITVNGIAVEPMTEIAWRGMPFDPISIAEDRAWFRPTYIPFAPTPDAIGTLARNKLSGIYQLDMFGPATGDDATEAQMIRVLTPIQEAFKRGTQHEAPGLCLTCMQSWVFNSTRDQNAARWLVSIRVRWSATLEN